MVRKPEQIQALPVGVSPRSCNASNAAEVALLAADQDLIISTVRPPVGSEGQLVTLTQSILQGATQSGVRVLVVGGAATLKIPGQGETTVLTDEGFLPESAVDIAKACLAQHEMCIADENADWA